MLTPIRGQERIDYGSQQGATASSFGVPTCGRFWLMFGGLQDHHLLHENNKLCKGI
jgi:hypothetical protein